jgi:hypothetical protein
LLKGKMQGRADEASDPAGHFFDYARIMRERRSPKRGCHFYVFPEAETFSRRWRGCALSHSKGGLCNSARTNAVAATSFVPVQRGTAMKTLFDALFLFVSSAEDVVVGRHPELIPLPLEIRVLASANCAFAPLT